MPSIFKSGVIALVGLLSVANAQSGTGGTGTPPTLPTTSAPFQNTTRTTTTASSTTTSSVLLTTSTVCTTIVSTVTACPAYTPCTVGAVITKTIPLYTTVCPVGSKPTYAPPVPPKSYVTSTIVVTETYTVTACPKTVTLCPIGAVTSRIYTTTTVCPYASETPGLPSPPTYPSEVPDTTIVVTHTVTPTYGGEQPPYPTPSTLTTYPVGSGTGTAPVGTATAPPAVYYPPVTTKVESPPQPGATYTQAPIYAGAGSKMGVSAMALVMAGVFAILG